MKSVFHNSQTRQRLENAKEVIMSSGKHHRSDVNDELNVLRWVARMDEQPEKPKMTWRGRRHKLVWDPSSRVWEATTPVFSGLRRGSKQHDSRYWNGGERPCQNIDRQWFWRISRWKRQWKMKQIRWRRIANAVLFENLYGFHTLSYETDTLRWVIQTPDH